jgi:hypothetical protein
LLRATTISGQTATIFTPNAGLFNTTSRLSGRLTVLYGAVSQRSQEPSFEGISPLSIGNLSLPSRGGWRFCVEGQGCSSYIQQEIRGLYTLVPGEGSYSIVAEGPERGFLGPTEDNNTFEVSSNGSFFNVAYFIQIQPTPAATASPSEAFAASAVLPVSGPIVESALPVSAPIVESFRLTNSDRFNSSATPEPANLADGRTLATGSLVAIILAPVAVVALAVGLIALRHCRFGSKNGEVESDETHYLTSEFVPNMNPNQGDSDELAGEHFED